MTPSFWFVVIIWLPSRDARREGEREQGAIAITVTVTVMEKSRERGRDDVDSGKWLKSKAQRGKEKTK